MSNPNPTPTAISAVCITVGDDHDMRTVLSRSGGTGSVFVGGPGNTMQFHGSPAQLRSLATAIADGANDIAAQEAERTDADIEHERALTHYSAMANEAEKAVSA